MILLLIFNVFLYAGYVAVFVIFAVLSNGHYRMLWGRSRLFGWMFPPRTGSAWREDAEAHNGPLATFAANWRKNCTWWKVNRSGMLALILFCLAAASVALDRGLAAINDVPPSIPAASIPFWPSPPDAPD